MKIKEERIINEFFLVDVTWQSKQKLQVIIVDTFGKNSYSSLELIISLVGKWKE